MIRITLSLLFIYPYNFKFVVYPSFEKNLDELEGEKCLGNLL